MNYGYNDENLCLEFFTGDASKIFRRLGAGNGFGHYTGEGGGWGDGLEHGDFRGTGIGNGHDLHFFGYQPITEIEHLINNTAINRS